ncbi:MAG TPA: Holliday junction resolvase RuvX [candidate division WOR-3 bacterium]|uniref:Putative pre-16S rRNA nuclease n=1 Tax=candidate division WOR-3 bacterium TaxID=2052148 RepID=A0A7C0XCV8_UNCW3|nr:Holliday junction resolvase RuvX [candidate division WOR-3 bacterium]
MSDYSRILGIDYGDARIGVAISDPTRTIARPLEVIEPGKVDPVERIAEIAKEYDVKLVILGLPKLMSGEEGEMAAKVREFMQKLKDRTDLEIRLVDERFTSKIAERELRKRKVKPSREKKKVDLYAASLLLQEYLDSHRDEG